ncbi:MAG: helix-turn-helix domain-containing protein [Oscillospiraceae bacterium]|nr:helix-turn-helix domain-containing protein [Oscillospiraceae bacterium]
MLEFKERLQLLRALNKVSQEDFAKALNISRGAVSGYETGIRTPDIDVLQNTAEFFGVSADYLLGISDVKNTDTDLQAICKALNLSERAVENLRNTKGKTTDLLLNSDEWNVFIDSISEVLKSKKDVEYKKFLATQCLLKMLNEI